MQDKQQHIMEREAQVQQIKAAHNSLAEARARLARAEAQHSKDVEMIDRLMEELRSCKSELSVSFNTH